jgi:hypothetical protein
MKWALSAHAVGATSMAAMNAMTAKLASLRITSLLRNNSQRYHLRSWMRSCHEYSLMRDQISI